ncbi:MAG: hypothetical protein WB297_02630 [Actinomycetota bacterium]
MYVEALGPDRCRIDPCAVCSYWDTKLEALNGGRDKLTLEQLEFVGMGESVRTQSGGWHQSAGLPSP